MNGEHGFITEAIVRTLFLSFLLWMFANQFDATETLVIGLYAVMEGAFLYWRFSR